MRFSICIFATLAALTGNPAKAAEHDNGPMAHYAQCMIAFSALGQSQDPALKVAAQMGAMFFAGHIFGLAPNVDLTSTLINEAEQLDEAATRTLVQQCGREMQERGAQISTAGKAMQAKATVQSPGNIR